MSRFTRVARSRVSGLHDVGYEGVITGRDALSLRSSTADPQGVTQPPLQSTYLYSICFNKCHPQLLVMSQMSTNQNNEKSHVRSSIRNELDDESRIKVKKPPKW